jgi:uncharacterized membrane protein (GlpM family)
MTWHTVALKFLAGGILVALFGLVGEVFASKRLSGVLGGAPSVALASLLVTMLTNGTGPLREMMTGMVFGAAAFLLYVNVVRGVARHATPLVGAPAAWLSWIAAVAVLLWAGR